MYVHNLNPVFIEIFGWPIRYYGIMYAMLFLSAFFLGRWYLKREGKNPDWADEILLYVIAAVILGARLGHVFFYEWPYYSSRPWEILYIWEGGLASHGAAFALAIAVWIIMKRTKFSFLFIADMVGLGACLGVMFIRIGNFINAEIVGRVTEMPWGVVFPCDGVAAGACGNLPRHPSQLYEALLGLFVFAVLVGLFTKMKNRPQGLLIGVFLILYFGGRFALEFFKEYDGALMLPPLTNGHVLSVPFVLVGMFILWKIFRKKAA